MHYYEHVDGCALSNTNKNSGTTDMPKRLILNKAYKCLIRHDPHIKVQTNEHCITQTTSFTSAAQIYFDIQK